jgi:hypothetical protein
MRQNYPGGSRFINQPPNGRRRNQYVAQSVNIRQNPAVKLINKDNVLIPNSSRDAKKHIRNQSNDDKLMEVEGFDQAGIQ